MAEVRTEVRRASPAPGSRRAASHPDAALPPHAEAAQEGKVVVAEPRALRHFLELARIAAAKHHIVGFQSRLQGLDHLLDGAAPFLGTQAAAAYLKAHPELLATWLDGVTTQDGKPGLPAVKTSLGIGG